MSGNKTDIFSARCFGSKGACMPFVIEPKGIDNCEEFGWRPENSSDLTSAESLGVIMKEGDKNVLLELFQEKYHFT